MARLIRWQCLMLNSEWDHDELANMRPWARNFELVGHGSDESVLEAKRTTSVMTLLDNLTAETAITGRRLVG